MSGKWSQNTEVGEQGKGTSWMLAALCDEVWFHRDSRRDLMEDSWRDLMEYSSLLLYPRKEMVETFFRSTPSLLLTLTKHWPQDSCLCLSSLFPIALEMTEHRNSTYLMHGPVFLDYVELKALQKHGASQASATSSFTVVRALLRCGNLLPMEDRKNQI